MRYHLIMIAFALLFLQLIVKAECTLPCWNKPCACCKTGECINSGEKIYCTDCIDGYTGDTCIEPCPLNCIYCSQIFFPSNRTCFSCKNGYYNGRPYDVAEYPVQNDCSLSCKKGCDVCESYKTCTKCKIHFYMDSTNACIECPKNCANCSSATNCSRCDDRYFKNSEGCEQCRPYCKRCDSYASCQECDHGFYLKEKYCKSCIEGNYTNEACIGELVPPDRPSFSTSKPNTGLVVGLVIGSIVVISVCIIVVTAIRRRREERSNCCFNSSERTHDQERTSATHDEENIELLPFRARRTSATRELPSAEKLTILQMQGTFSAIEKKYDDMKIKVSGNKVTVEGDPFDIENAFKEIDNKCGDIEQVEYTHSKSRAWLRFYQKQQTIEYVQKKMKQKQLHGIWDITGTELTVFVNAKGNSENFKNTLLESVLEMSVPVHKSLLNSEWWPEFLLDIRRIFQEKVDIFTKEQQDAVIICTDDVVKLVTKMFSEFLEGITDAIMLEPGVSEFVSKYWTQDDFDEIRTIGVMIKTKVNEFKLRGLLNNVIKGKQELMKKLKGFISKQYHVLEGTGLGIVLEAIKHSGTISDIETECRCVIKLPQEIGESPSKMLCDHEVIDSDILEIQNSNTNTFPKCFQTRRHKIKVQLIQGDMCHQTADIIVVRVASNIDLRSGSAVISLFKQGGPKLQIDLNRLYPNGIQDGEVAVIDSGDFSCDKIYLTSLPPWQEAMCNGGKILRNFMRECLRLADKYDKKTIAFSSMVTGMDLGYPMDLAVSIMYGAVVEYDSSYSKTSLKEINIVEDDETIKTYRLCHLKTHGKEDRNNRIFIDGGTILIKPEEDSKFRMVKDGCAIGPIQLQVQVGDILNNTADAIVMRVGAQCSMKDPDLKRDGIIITANDELETKYMITVQVQDSLCGWRAKLFDCLEEASKKSIQSIAFPLLKSGAGPKAFSPDGIGACLFAAIDDFTSQNPVSSVTDVRLVVPDSNAGCIPAIIAALQDRTTAVNFRWKIEKIFKSQLGTCCVADSNQINETSIYVYSDATINIDRCIKALYDRIGLEYATKVVDADRDVISCLRVEKIKSFIDADILVDVKFVEQASKFIIFGPLRNVMAAITCLHNKMRQYNSAKVMYDQIKWHWQCEDRLALEREFPYDMMSNFVIETAYREGKQTAELQSKDGKIYVIDFQKLIECPKINIYDTVMVIRKDVLKEIPNLGTLFVLRIWNIVNSGNIVVVTLMRDAKYQKVEERFLAEVRNGINRSKVNYNQSVEIVKIERIQNKILYQHYQAKKKMMKEQKGRKLWHDTDEENIFKIITNGFNRSYCGVHEVALGQGVYFYADAFYTVRSNLAENKPGVKRYMFLANVLTGELIRGNPSMRVLPLVNPDQPTITYDSAVDDVSNPMQFVIFHVTQAYPKYLITYTSK